MFRSVKDHPNLALNVAINKGGMGDAIAAFPVIRYIKKNYSNNHKIYYWVHDFLRPLMQFTFPDIELFGISDKVRKPNLMKNPLIHMNYKKPTGTKFHGTDYASMMLVDHLIPDSEKDYLQPDPTPIKLPRHRFGEFWEAKEAGKKIILISCLHTVDTRVFLPEEVNKLAQMITNKGWVPIFVGKEDIKANVYDKQTITGRGADEVDMDSGVNYVNETSILELLRLCHEADAVVGVDNGILHLAAMTDTFIVGGFTIVDPKDRLPWRHGVKGWNYETVIAENLACNHCQTNWAYEIEAEFKWCHYVQQGLDTEIKCVKAMTAEKFMEKLENKLGN